MRDSQMYCITTSLFMAALALANDLPGVLVLGGMVVIHTVGGIKALIDEGAAQQAAAAKDGEQNEKEKS